MIGDPVVTIFCDRCADEIVTGLTPLAGGVWDGRNISGVTKRQHWRLSLIRRIAIFGVILLSFGGQALAAGPGGWSAVLAPVGSHHVPNGIRSMVAVLNGPCAVMALFENVSIIDPSKKHLSREPARLRIPIRNRMVRSCEIDNHFHGYGRFSREQFEFDDLAERD